MQPNLRHKLLAGSVAGALVLGAGAVAGAASGVGPFSSDDAGFSSAGSAGTSGTAATQPDDGAETESSQFVDLPTGAIQTFSAGPAGTVTISRTDGTLGIVAASPAAGFTIDEQQAAGREVEIRFVGVGVVVRFDAEFEDGAVRIRVRQRGIGATASTTPNSLTPVTVDDNEHEGEFEDRDNGDANDDHGGNSGPGGGDEDNSGPGGGDEDNSGPGGDDD